MKKIIYIIILVLVLSACKTLESVSNEVFNPNIKSRRLEKIIKKNDFDFDYFSSKIRVNYNGQTFTANLRMKQDSMIWISLTGPFNIEGARVIITKNNFQMINKLNRTYYNESLSFIKNYFPMEVDFKMMENLIIGNFLESKIIKQKIETKDQKYLVKGGIEGLDILYELLENTKIYTVNIQNIKEKQKITVDYPKYETVENQSFATRRKFIITDNDIENSIDLKFYKWNSEKQIFPFKVPLGYTKQ